MRDIPAPIHQWDFHLFTYRHTFTMFVKVKMSEDRCIKPNPIGMRQTILLRRMDGLLRLLIGLSLVRVQLSPQGEVAQMVEQHVPFRTFSSTMN